MLSLEPTEILVCRTPKRNMAFAQILLVFVVLLHIAKGYDFYAWNFDIIMEQSSFIEDQFLFSNLLPDGLMDVAVYINAVLRQMELEALDDTRVNRDVCYVDNVCYIFEYVFNSTLLHK